MLVVGRRQVSARMIDSNLPLGVVEHLRCNDLSGHGWPIKGENVYPTLRVAHCYQHAIKIQIGFFWVNIYCILLPFWWATRAMVVISPPAILTFPLDQRSDLLGMRWIDASDRGRRIPTITGYPTEFALYVPSGNVNFSLNMLVINHGWPWIDTWEFKIGCWRFILRYTTLLKGHLAAGDMTSAWKLLEDMEVSCPKLSWFGWESMLFSWSWTFSWWMEPGKLPFSHPYPTFQRQPETSAVYPDLRTVNTFLRGCVKLGALENAEAGPFRVGGLLGGRWVGILEVFDVTQMAQSWPSVFFDTTHMLPKMTMSGILRTCKDIFLEVSTWCCHLQVTWPPTFGSGGRS